MSPSNLSTKRDTSACLSELLFDLLPENTSMGCPSGNFVDLLEFATRMNSESLINNVYHTVSKLADELGFADYATLNANARSTLLGMFRRRHLHLFLDFLSLAIQCYCLHPKIKAAFGQSDRPPFPHGEMVVHGDFSLLEVVYERGHFYRIC